MGYAQPPEGRGFQPGKSGNPRGAQLHNPVAKRLKKLTNEQLSELGTLLLESKVADLKAVVKDPTSSSLKAAMASVLIKAIKKGDCRAMEILLSRIVGKRRTAVNSSESTAPKIEIPSELAALKGRDLVKYFRDMAQELEDCLEAEGR